ncbi:MAG TPA: TetR/AcrR family transcriptional regulator [Sphingomicrobium sp.]|nr:TetR/AcrR family transcriptional regulator [Sphingomicrobium sp.]
MAREAGSVRHSKLPIKGAKSLAAEGKAPRTQRGARTLRKILDAALAEFGARGFGDTSIVGITSRAGVALGTFYTYFDSKEALFAALVRDMSAQVREQVAPAMAEASGALDREQRALGAYLRFVSQHKEVYRIIDEAEFVDPAGFRRHYETTAARIAARLEAGAEAGELKDGDKLTTEIRAWALMGMNVFLGLRFGVWSNEPPERVAEEVGRLLAEGLKR